MTVAERRESADAGNRPRRRTDTTLLAVTAVCVAALAVVAGAVSFAHMRELALLHGQTGWKALAFPISVDGLEIVASLYLVAQRRAGRPPGATPWVALIVGTAASLAANVAVGGDDPIGKALAGWPALSMLVSIKLLFSMIDHSTVDPRTTPAAVPDDRRTAVIVQDIPGTASANDLPPQAITGRRSADSQPSGTGPHNQPDASEDRSADRDRPTAVVDAAGIADHLAAAREAQKILADAGRSLSRDNLADAMRTAGHGVSNARASMLLKALRAE